MRFRDILANTDLLIGVVAEEMLHLSLAGNVLRAVGGTPKLYDPNYMPYYPMLMPGRVPKLWLQLRKANKANLQTFIDVSALSRRGLLYLLTPML